MGQSMDREKKRAQLRAGLLELIRQNENGGRLPTERELSGRFDVARDTLRRCLQSLENEGLLERKQGIGTFVVARPVVKEAKLMSFSEEMRQRGLTPSSKLLSTSIILAGAKLAQRLKLIPGSAVLEVRRLRLANDEPIALETSYLAQSRVPNFDASALANGSLYALLGKEYGLNICYASQQIQATVLNEQEAEWLRVPPFSPALVVKRTTVLNTGEFIEYAKSLYRADRYRLELNVTR
jgi:GntR family transcriptional regulator